MPRKMDPFYDSFGTLAPRAPTPLERIASELSRLAYGNDDRAGTQNMLSLMGNSPNRTPENRLVDMLNPLATIDAAYNSGQDVGNGNYLAGAIGLGAAALPFPGKQEAGPVVREVINNPLKSIANVISGKEKELASRSARMYNPRSLPQRGFDLDYPNGAASDATGRLLATMDGEPFTGAPVAGRTHIGQGDTGIPAPAYVSLAEKATGRLPEEVAKSQIGGDAGQYVVDRDRRSGKVISRDIFLDKNLEPAQKERVLAHELSHAIDEISGIIPADGLNDELRDVYNHLNNPQSHGPKIGPEHRGYSGEQARRELIGEGIRAYITDPNYLKTVAPRVAAAIRKAVNTHPTLSKIIQFNSLAGLGLGLGATTEPDRDSDS